MRENKGITLISLAITIVILIIISGVAIGAVANNGLFNKSKEVQNLYEETAESQDEKLDEYFAKNYKEILGTVQKGETAKKGNRYYESDGKTAVIPKGFTVSGIDGEDSIENGLVIYQTGGQDITNWNTAKTTYNQWVWIPVDNVEDMYTYSEEGVALSGNTGVKTNYYSKTTTLGNRTIQRVTPGDTSGYREPDIVIGNGSQYDAANYSTAGFYSLEDMAKNLTNDYKEMIDSVQRYGGFYIGRYEITGTVDNPLEKSGTVITSTNWYNLYKACKNLGKNNDKIETRMIWGNQWDQACKFISTKGDKVDLDDSTSYGNYSNSTGNAATNSGSSNFNSTTGRNEYWKTNNIYDLAGNCWEWTQETYDAYCRYLNGGCNINSAIDFSVNCHYASNNVNVPTSTVGSSWSTRPTLYIRPEQKSSLEKLKDAGTYTTKKTTVRDSNGNKVKIPQGFKIASDSGINVTEGIVIEDNDIISGVGNGRGNQYVWIPVSNIDGDNNSNGTEDNLITLSDGTKVEITLGRYTFNTTNGTPTLVQKGSQASEVTSSNYSSKTSYRIDNYFYELSETRTSDGSTTNTTAQNMSGFIESVRNNNGYYIARYEASYGTDGKANSKVSDNVRTDSSTALTNGMLWNFVTQPQASVACQNLNNSISSDLINSYAWDTAVVYIQAMGNSNYANADRENNNSLINTGTTGDEKCKINDMAKNEGEWTTEYSIYSSEYCCTNRGGIIVNGRHTIVRDYSKATGNFNYMSFRPILWL